MQSGTGSRALAVAVAAGLLGGSLVAAEGTALGVPASPLARSGPAPASTYAVVASIPVGTSPRGISIDLGDDTVYVANYGDDSVSVINGRSRSVAGTITTVGVEPWDTAVDIDDDTLYVTNKFSDTVSIIRGRSLSLARTVPVFNEPRNLAVNQDDDTFYVSGYVSNTVMEIRGASADDSRSLAVTAAEGLAVNQVDDTLYASSLTTDRVWAFRGRNLDDSVRVAVGDEPWGIAVNDGDDSVYVANKSSQSVSILRGGSLDDSTRVVTAAEPYFIAVNQVDDAVYVTQPFAGVVTVFSGVNPDDSGTLAVNGLPWGVAVDDSGAAWVTQGSRDQVSVIARVTPTLLTASGAVGSNATLTVTTSQADGLVDDSTVQRVHFGDDTATALTRSAGANAWSMTVPPGTGTVPVTVTFAGGLIASAGSFAYTPSPAPPTPVPPGAPRELAVSAGDRAVDVSWQPPASSGSFAIGTYQAEASPRGATCLVNAPAQACTIPGLSNGTTYTVRVRALSGAGWGEWSAPSDPVTPVGPTPPSATIVIVGSRGTGVNAARVYVSGTTTGLAGQKVRARVRLAGQARYKSGALRPVAADGRFTWQRKSKRRTYVDFKSGATRSKRIIIPALTPR